MGIPARRSEVGYQRVGIQVPKPSRKPGIFEMPGF